jgi:5'-nucleotidase
MNHPIRRCLGFAILLLVPALGLALATAAEAADDAPPPLRILLTNDDGFDSAGIEALRAALTAAGHHVTVVAPATQQSGKGGSINTGAFDFTPGGGTMLLMNRGNRVWSLEGSPADSVTTGLDVVMADDPPDLIVSGLNEGQNIGRPGTNASGTEGAALRGLFRGIPAIAGSMEVDFSEASEGFPSTEISYAPAADFMTRLIARLQEAYGKDLLPRRTGMLNVNFPVPFDVIRGVRITSLAEGSDIELPHFDPSQGFPAFGIPPIPSFPPCAEAVDPGDFCFSTVGFGLSPTPDPVRGSDLDALREDFITITPIDGDMTAGSSLGALRGQLRPLAP